ncbi:type I polyketide synthase [Kribbella antibiotica]|uniref:Type I polyketide synthase n=1 Tax=Kribbella antibiotica TaxID=190195 RepID=A0A4R4ZJ19_9ACTN|nr:type I polyketide synthase [Kribbella antibiotica]TDD58603.1 type I polyketide synthase [Kribbella antibiotica]
MTDRSPADRSREPIAIVGIGCQFPGANGPGAFWDLLCNGTDATRDLPADRWETGKFYDPAGGKLGKMSTFHGGFLDRIDEFDAQFFGISPREAIWLDPQQRLLLQVAWEAMEDGGQVADELAGTDVGVFMGGFTLDYQLLQNYGIYSRYELQTHSATGMMMTMLANRLSYSFDFKGPSLAVDTACSGSLVAVHLAAQAIANGECSMALAGGVNVMIAPNMTIAESKGGFLAPDGRSKAFSAAANGYARGEGAGIVVLKPLRDAQRNGDPIYALIRGSSVSQDGHTNGITVPNGDSQATAMRAAYQRAGIAPRDVQYVEAHGTGTPVGDPIEAGAIGRVVGAGRADTDRVVIGSVKTNIGHLEAAAGVAGLIKTALSLKHGQIPGQLHFNDPNPAIDFDQLGLRVQTQLGNWPETSGPRFAGVNSFGFGGTNAHVVLEGPPAEVAPTRRPHDRRYLIPLSGRSPEALTAAAASTAEHLSENAVHLQDVGHTTSLRRSHHEHRLAVVASTPADATKYLREFSAGRATKGVTSGRAAAGGRPKLAFVFSGMGPQWWAMARQLLTTEPVFRAAVERCDKELRKYTDWSLLDEMLATEDASQMAETRIAQTANFAVQVGLAAMWRMWGIEPDGIVGHSTGEVAAQYLSGVLSFEDAVKVNYYRSSLQQRATGTGRMLAVGLTPETLDKAVADAGPLVSVAAINSPSAVTLSGDAAILESMAAQLETFGVFHKFLAVKVPYHSHCMDPLRDDLQAGLADLTAKSATVPLYSTVTGTTIDGAGVNAHYWWQNVRATVLFASAFREMLADGFTHFVEIGPHPVLAGSMKELAAEQQAEVLVVPSLRRDEEDDAVLLGSLGSLYAHGQDVKWEAFYGDGAHIQLPTYPWQKKRYWNESVEAREDRHYTEVHPLLGQRVSGSQPAWEREFGVGVLPYLADHRIQGTTLVPGAAMIEMALAAAHEVYGDDCYTVENLEFRKAVVLPETADPRLRTTLHQESGRVEIAGYTATVSGDRTWTIHATAQLGRRTTAPARRDLEAARAACDNNVSRDDFYDRSRQMGFEYGPVFQAVQDIVSGPGSAVGRVTVPEQIRDDLSSYRFHPALIDAAFQVLLTAATPQGDGPGTPYLPVGVDSIVIHEPAQDEMFVVAEVVQADARVVVSDLALCAADGTVLAEIRGFRAQSLQAASNQSLDRLDRNLHELSWREQPLDAEPATEPDSATWVVFTDSSGDAVRRLRAAGRQVISVEHNAVPKLTETETGGYVLNPADADQYKQLFHKLGQEVSVGKVLHLWSLDAPFGADISVDALEDSQLLGSVSVLNLMHALAAELNHQLAQVWLVTRQAQAIDGGPVAVAQAPMWGIGRLVGHQEFPSLWGGLVDLGPGDDAEQLIAEIDAAAGEDQVAYRNGQRFVARLAPSTHLTPPFPVRLRPNGSYVITGGLGTLGLLVARFLVDRGARHVVLMARTAVPTRDTWRELPADHPQRGLIDQLLKLETSGATVSCVAVDSADEDQLHSWYDDHQRNHLPPISGLIHTAGVVEDELMVRMTRESFDRVLRPKLRAGWLLHRLFADVPLDFFVLFGSTGSVIASAGQANYAAANAFLDGLAAHRRRQGLPALTIGWGPWSIGMVEKLQLEQMYARRGIELITPEAGTQILARVLSQRPAHLVAITVDWPAARAASIGAQLPPMFAELGVSSGDEQSSESAVDADSILDGIRQASEEERETLLRGLLRDIAATVLNLDAADLGDEENLSNLGIDSMMAVEVKARIDIMLRVDIPVLDLLQGVSVVELAARILPRLDLEATPADQPETAPAAAEPSDDELDQLLASASPDELEALLAELEREEGMDHEPAS